MPPLTTRILGASTLVSVPLALLSVGFNRFSYAAISFVMMATYHVLLLAAGATHLDRFGANLPMTVNYFGGALMFAVLGYGLWMGWRRRLVPTPINDWPRWTPSLSFRICLVLLGAGFIALGILFFAMAAQAAAVWIDAKA